MKEEEGEKELANFPQLVEELRALVKKFSPTLPIINRALVIIFNVKKEKR